MGGTPDLDLLNVFLAVAETGRFSLAAARLGMPKSSVSRRLARLEASLGTQLLHRTTHAVGLTTAGTALFERVRPLVASLHEAVGALPEQAEEPSGVLRVTTANDLGAAFLAEVGARFLLRFPQIRLDARLTYTTVDLAAEGIDVALRVSMGPLRDSTLVVRRLARLDIHLFAAPGYLARRGTPKNPEDLAHHDLVAFRSRRAPALPISEARARIVADDYFFLRESLRAGAGIGALPAFLARDELQSGGLVRVLPRLADRRATLFLAYPRMQHVPAKTRVFRDFLLESLTLRPLGT